MMSRRIYENAPGTSIVIGSQKSVLNTLARRTNLLGRKRFALCKHTAPDTSLRHEFCSCVKTIKGARGRCSKKGDKRRRALGIRKRRGWRKNGKLMKLQPLDRQILV
jgi:hypothetical protein